MTRAEAWHEARRLVVEEQWGYSEAAKAVGLPLSSLQKRAAREGWQNQRQADNSYHAQVRALKVAALKKATENPGDAQAIYAWVKMEQAWPEHRYGGAQDPATRRAAALEMFEALIDYLGDED
ncbi:MAG: hypothetical protein KC492_05510, partial [Myxococcales bacterium]|nr:hypothetical protein [Myxococcales bacterium]